MRRAVMWFRRDLRLADNPALRAALDAADEVVPVFVLDPGIAGSVAGSVLPRTAFLHGCLAELRDSTGGALMVRSGAPAKVLADVVRETGAGAVFVTGASTPLGRRRDARVGGSVRLESIGSAYAVEPGRLQGSAGRPVLPRPARRRRCGEQQPRVAMGRRHRSPGSSTRRCRRSASIRTGTTSAGGSRSSGTSPAGPCTNHGSNPVGRPTGTPGPWSITASSA